VQNVGESVVQLDEDSCLYVDGVLVPCFISNVSVTQSTATLGLGETAKLRYADGAALAGDRISVKVTTKSGTSAEQTGYPAGNTRIPKLDHFEFNNISSPKTSGLPFNVIIRAVDQYGETFTDYAGSNSLIFSGGDMTPSETESFVNGVWSGEVTIIRVGNSFTIVTQSHSDPTKTGTSNTFAVSIAGTMWSQTYEGTGFDAVSSIVEASDGGYALSGFVASLGAGLSDFWLIKTDAFGNVEWNQTYGGPEDDIAYNLVKSPDGGYALAGWTESFGAGGHDFWLVKVDELGNMEWSHTYGGTENEVAESLIMTDDEGYLLVGTKEGDCWVVKTDADGNIMWNHIYGGTENDGANSVAKTSDGGYIIVGSTDSFGAGASDAWLIKIDAFGVEEWNNTYGGPENDRAESVVVTSEGDYVIAGSTRSFGAGASDAWLIKTDENGVKEWNQTYGGVNTEGAGDLFRTSDGGYVMAGETRSYGAGDMDWWLVRTDGSGNLLWNQTYGGAELDFVQAAIATSDGKYVIAGGTVSFGSATFEICLLKTA
jgi:hypothetical protein